MIFSKSWVHKKLKANTVNNSFERSKSVFCKAVFSNEPGLMCEKFCLEGRSQKSLISCPADKKVSEAFAAWIRSLAALRKMVVSVLFSQTLAMLPPATQLCVRSHSLFLLNYVFILQVAEDMFHLWHTFLMFSRCWTAFIGMSGMPSRSPHGWFVVSFNVCVDLCQRSRYLSFDQGQFDLQPAVINRHKLHNK